jgi:hypothetical protein
MLELTVTSTRGYKIPAIGLEQPENFANLHAASISAAYCKARATTGKARLSATAARCVTPNV